MIKHSKDRDYRRSRAQSMIEYALLVGISVIAFLVFSTALNNLKNSGGFKNHFDKVYDGVTGNSLQ